MDIERQLEINEARHFRANDRFLDKIERAEREIEKRGLIGELIRNGKTIYYINLLTRDGLFTGKTREGIEGDLIAYMIRNHYV